LRKAYGYDFHLTHAYTQIEVKTKADVASLFPSFGAFGLFDAVESKEYMGY
jgi:hypothetical protein